MSLTGQLTAEVIAQLDQQFAADPQRKLMQNALSNAPLSKVALNQSVVADLDRSMSVKLDDWKVANQKKSGRCWLFSGLNLLRPEVMHRLNLEGFEFSQNYLFYWDKLEKANWFLENQLDLADRDVDDRTVAHLLSDPIGDGGQWNMFVALIEKYGVVPKWAMPETYSSSCSAELDDQLERYLRQGAYLLREAVKDLPGVARALKAELLAGIHRMLNIHLGTPPRDFIWQYNDKDNKFHRLGRVTPQQFAREYIPNQLSEYVCLVNDPRNEYGQLYTVDRLGNVIGGKPVTYLNVPIQVMKDCTQQVLEDGSPVWFGCDTAQQAERQLSAWDQQMFEYGPVYAVDYCMDKATRVRFHDSQMTHAMLFVGVDVLEGKPRRWRVENSWGAEDKADKGFYTMNDNWYDQYVFEIAVPQSYLSAEYQQIVTQGTDPIVLPAWDPMGSLA